MSQSTVPAAVSSQRVQNSISTFLDREKALLANVDVVTNSVTTTADYLAVLGDNEMVAAYKDLMTNLGQLAHEVQAHQEALKGLGQSYQASQRDTDFKAQLQQRLGEQLQRKPYDPRSDARMREFLQTVGPAAGGGAGAADGELGEDEELEMVEDGGRQWVNDKCPLSMKEVLDLERPVKDPLGYVYEYASIMEYLRQGAHNGYKHPVAGVQQLLRPGDLVPAVEVARAKRRRILQMNLQGRGNAGREEAEEFIDV